MQQEKHFNIISYVCIQYLYIKLVAKNIFSNLKNNIKFKYQSAILRI
jgi:hypothetical protein